MGLGVRLWRFLINSDLESAVILRVTPQDWWIDSPCIFLPILLQRHGSVWDGLLSALTELPSKYCTQCYGCAGRACCRMWWITRRQTRQEISYLACGFHSSGCLMQSNGMHLSCRDYVFHSFQHMAEWAWYSEGGTELVFSSLHQAAREPEEVSRNECTQPATKEAFPGAPRWAWLQPSQCHQTFRLEET